MVHLTLWYMMDHNGNSKSPSSSGSIDMRHLIKPRGRGYSLRMLTPPVLVGTKNPWTAKPFGKEIKLGLDTRSHAEALRIRDVRVGQIRQLESDAIAASGRGGIGRIMDLSPEAAEDWRKMRMEATQEELEGYDYVLSDQLDAAVDAGKEREAETFGALVFKGAVPLERAMEQYLEERKEGNVFGFDPLAVTTALNIKSTIKHLVAFLDMETPLLDDVTPNKAFQFYTKYLPVEKELGAGTVTKHVNFMRGLWNWALVDKGYLKRRNGKAIPNPWVITEKGTSKKRASARSGNAKRTAFTSEQVASLLAGWSDWGARQGDIMRLALVTGCRADEMGALPLLNVRADGSCFEITRGKSANAARLIPVVGDAQELLRRRVQVVTAAQVDVPASERRLFPEWPLKPSTGKANSVSQWFTRYRREALGKETDDTLAFHSFRHTWKTVARRAGVADDRVRDLGGWQGGVSGRRDASDGYDHGLLEQQLFEAQWEIWRGLQDQGFLIGF
ncbi:tyrosine-type recombinase/integrase [Sulfitobacter sp.]|uniref:tyrosine-type recombinase/integrase n=1 Tax=Sulfitobacter sp. TaxID=1903071 RepID=UPI003EF59525